MTEAQYTERWPKTGVTGRDVRLGPAPMGFDAVSGQSKLQDTH